MVVCNGLRDAMGDQEAVGPVLDHRSEVLGRQQNTLRHGSADNIAIVVYCLEFVFIFGRVEARYLVDLRNSLHSVSNHNSFSACTHHNPLRYSVYS